MAPQEVFHISRNDKQQPGMKAVAVLLALLSAAASLREALESLAARYLGRLDAITHTFDLKLWGEARASRYTGRYARRARAGELGIFPVQWLAVGPMAALIGVRGVNGVLVFGAIALVVVSIVLLLFEL